MFGECTGTFAVLRGCSRIPGLSNQLNATSQQSFNRALTRYVDALRAANDQDEALYASRFTEAVNYTNQVNHVHALGYLMEVQNQVHGVAQTAFARSQEEQQRYQEGDAAADSMWSRLRSFNTTAPSNADIIETAIDQSVQDVADGRPFRSAAEQGITWGGLVRNIQYSLTGENPQDIRRPGETAVATGEGGWFDLSVFPEVCGRLGPAGRLFCTNGRVNMIRTLITISLIAGLCYFIFKE